MSENTNKVKMGCILEEYHGGCQRAHIQVWGLPLTCHMPMGKPLNLSGLQRDEDSLEKLCYPLLHPVSCQNGSSQAQPPTTLTFLIYPQCRTQNLDLSPLGDGSIQLQISHQLCNESSRPMVSVIVAKEKPMNPSSQVVCDDDPKSIFSSVFEEGT